MRLGGNRALIVPEVVQTSAMDCGPASLKCLLDGFGLRVSYGRLREACQTDVDGTSIDTLEEVANQLGLEAEQVMIPVDHLLLPGSRSLPALVVVRLAQGLTHFVVAWSHGGGLVQVMDPSTGRRWPRSRELLDELYVHSMPVPADAWRAFAATEEFLEPLSIRLARLGIGRGAVTHLTDRSLADPGPLGLAALDAATRMVESLALAGGLRRGREAEGVLNAFVDDTIAGFTPGAEPVVPRAFWSAFPTKPGDDGEAEVVLTGAVLVRARGLRDDVTRTDTEERAPLPPELAAALEEKPAHPLREMLDMLRADGATAPAATALAVVASAGAVVFQALLFRGVLELPRVLGPPEQRLAGFAAILAFVLALLLLELPIQANVLRMGRKLETRLRAAFQAKLPRLGDRYLHSRLTSDMAERSHALPAIRHVPELGARLLRSATMLLFTTAGIAWLDPAGAPLAALVAALSVAVPLGVQRVLAERDLRVRTHAGALMRFYLDALLGLVAVRAHGAQRSLRREHEGLIVEWARASVGLLRAGVVVEGVLALLGMTLAGALLLSHLARADEAGMVLLLVYWALQLPALGADVASVAIAYPSTRNVALRLLEPLGALEEADVDARVRTSLAPPAAQPAIHGRGVAIELRDVTVKAGGHTILDRVSVEVPAGAQVGVVGPSGAGKSSLVGLLLGWTRPSEGDALVDGALLDAERIEALRTQTAWVDPAVQLWNRTALENLCYGATDGEDIDLGEVIAQADLKPILETLPEGLQTTLGEGGGLVSGGEGQRLRIGRALLRRDVRLVILDEAFRGLDRDQRRELLARARAWWQGATMLCVSHDIGSTLDLDRVLVVEGGRIVEDGAPRELAARPGSRYRAMLDAEAAVTSGAWAGVSWRRLILERGRTREVPDER